MDMLAHENAVLDINNLLEISKDAGLENTGIRCVCRMSKITIGAAIWLKHLKNGLIRTFRRCEISQLCGFPNFFFSLFKSVDLSRFSVLLFACRRHHTLSAGC